jgi:lauroyl/myristoyl acyltransferase
VDKRKTTLARTIAYILEAVAVIALATIFSRLPRTIIRRFGVLSGRILFRLDRKDRKQAYHNLDIVFKEPHLLPSEKDRAVKRLFENIAALTFEYLQLDRLPHLL